MDNTIIAGDSLIHKSTFMKKLLSAVLVLTFLASCKKEVDELPPDTQTGANTFGAKVNGTMWVPQGFGPFPASNLLEASFVGNDVRISARNFSSSPNETEFYIHLVNVTAPGTYQLNTNVSHPSYTSSYAYYVKRNITPTDEWITTSQETGEVVVTRIDIAKMIVSGTFRFTGKNIYGSSTNISVTEGRFDIKAQ